MRYTVRPISDRTPFTGKHERSRFDSTWSRTQAQLFTEVRQLNGRDLVLEVDVTESMIRLDGGLYANARPASPAVRVAFDSVHGPLVYATDRFSTWQDNVRAIALGLEALRKVDRYGITKRGEQYTGWKAIGSGPATAMPSGMTAEQACQVLADAAGWTTPPDAGDPSVIRLALKRARFATHTDRGGSREAWDRVEQAAKVLGVLS